MYAANEPKTKAVVSVAEMARMVGLVTRAIPSACRHDVPLAAIRHWQPRRPFYTEEVPEVCLSRAASQLRHRRQAGAVLRTRPVTATPVRKPKQAEAAEGRHADLLDGLKGLGLADVDCRPGGRSGRGTLPTGGEGVNRWRGLAGRFPSPSPPEYRR